MKTLLRSLHPIGPKGPPDQDQTPLNHTTILNDVLSNAPIVVKLVIPNVIALLNNVIQATTNEQLDPDTDPHVHQDLDHHLDDGLHAIPGLTDVLLGLQATDIEPTLLRKMKTPTVNPPLPVLPPMKTRHRLLTILMLMPPQNMVLLLPILASSIIHQQLRATSLPTYGLLIQVQLLT